MKFIFQKRLPGKKMDSMMRSNLTNEEKLIVQDSELFAQVLFGKMKQITPAIQNMELFEFKYALENLVPKSGWETINLEDPEIIEKRVNDDAFYFSILLKPVRNGKKVLDDQVLNLSQQILLGLALNVYSTEWVLEHFYFDIRGFYFLHKTRYFDQEIINWLGGKPFVAYEQKQKEFQKLFDVGYKIFKEANRSVDEFLIRLMNEIIKQHSKPLLIALAGQTAAGKTEIVSRLTNVFKEQGLSVTSLEIDHFLTDREERELKGIDSLGKEAFHFDLFIRALEALRKGKVTKIPEYDFIEAVSSHTTDGKLKPGKIMLTVFPADVIFIEGNFPFLYSEVAKIIDIKIMYLTDDAIRLKRKWKRDVDYRKKYELTYFMNRYFREQFLMAEKAYIPQMKKCDILVDTTEAKVWIAPPFQKKFNLSENKHS